MNKFKFSVLTLNGTVFEDRVEKVVISTTNGEITILKNHIPLITTTTKGRLVIFKDSEVIEHSTNEGLLKINREETILMSEKLQNLK